MKLFYRLIKPPSYIAKLRDILQKISKARQARNISTAATAETITDGIADRTQFEVPDSTADSIANGLPDEREVVVSTEQTSEHENQSTDKQGRDISMANTPSSSNNTISSTRTQVTRRQAPTWDVRSWFGRYDWLPGMTNQAVINVANSSENLNFQIGMMLNASSQARQRSRQARQALRSTDSILYYALVITTVLSIPLYVMIPILAVKTVADFGLIGGVLYQQARHVLRWYRTKRYNRRFSKGKYYDSMEGKDGFTKRNR